MKYKITAFKKRTFYRFRNGFSRLGRKQRGKDENFFVTTRREQDALRVLRAENDCDWWEILDNFDENGFELSCAVKPDNSFKKVFTRSDYSALAEKTANEKYDNVFDRESLEKTLKSFKTFKIDGKYAVFVSENKDFPMDMLDDFTKAVYSGIDGYDFTRDETRPELLKIHWCKREKIHERRLEIFIPVK